MYMNCSQVTLSTSHLQGLGAFAKCDFKEGEMVEYGVARVLTNVDGHENPILFTWSDKNPNKKWAILSGCAHFYNTSLNPNTEVIRNFQDNTFKINAKRDIKKGEELTHRYKSLKWRKCFTKLNLK